ncbi:MAG: zinc ribbon domain-containing protein [Pirellulales bacterium]|nr:zinc ribbon domain-containing protein [Pirellulales bacterium]
MPIEFRCTQCSKLLQTPDDTAGKHAKCPVCGSIVQIPAAGPAAPAGPSEGVGGGAPPSPPAGDSASPFAGGPPPTPGLEPLNPYQAPTAYGTMPQDVAPPGEIRHTIIDVGDVFSRTWAIFKQQWGMIWVMILVVQGIGFVANMLLSILQSFAFEIARNEFLAMTVMIVGNLGLMVLSIWLGVGQTIYLLKIARGQSADLGSLFAGGPKLLTALLASLLYGLIVFGIVLVCIVPGIVLSVALSTPVFIFFFIILAIVPVAIIVLMLSQYLYLIVDQDAGVVDSLKLSKEITSGNKAILLVIGLLTLLLLFAAILPCFLGLLVMIPFSTLMPAVIYLVMTGQRTADQWQTGEGR